MSIVKRVYVGSVLNNQDACFADLCSRFQKFGRVVDNPVQFEQHDSYGYLNMEFSTASDFEKLRNNFNKVKFKENLLLVAEAKPDWKARWEIDQNDTERELKKRKQMLKQEWEHYKKIENVNKSWIDRKELISGRNRKSARTSDKLRHITFRVLVNGKLKVFKCHKTKLWGYEKNKNVRDLVYKFTNNYWRSGTDHIVDKLDYSRAKSVTFGNSLGHTVTISAENEGFAEESEEMTDAEKEKTTAVLSSLLHNFDFDKPIAVKDVASDEENAGADYEYEALHKELGEQSVLKIASKVEIVPIKEGEFAKISEQPKDVAMEDARSVESDDDFIPTFGATTVHADGNEPVETNTTEVLRGLFNNTDQAEFKLIEESDEDIDREKDVKTDQIALPIPVEPTVEPKSNQALFFLHQDSPFLVGQTRLAKVKAPFNAEETLKDWEDKFWDNRSKWTKELKQRRRDVIRQIRKRKDKYSGRTQLI